MRGHRDLKVVAASSLLCALAALLVPFEAVRLVVAAPLALLLPGYAIVAASFARRRLPWPQFAVLSLALSLATLALGALVLNYAPGGIRSLSWAVLLLLVVLNGCRVAALRRPRGSGAPSWPRLPLRRVEGGLLLAGLSLAIVALVLASTTLPARDAIGYTQLWILPAAGSAGVQVGVASEEQDPLAYDLRIRLGDRRIVRRSFELKPGESRIVRIGASPPSSGTSAPVVATLLRHNRPYSVYRRVKGWFSAPEASR